jgi:hypothetical protein
MWKNMVTDWHSIVYNEHATNPELRIMNYGNPKDTKFYST